MKRIFIFTILLTFFTFVACKNDASTDNSQKDTTEIVKNSENITETTENPTESNTDATDVVAENSFDENSYSAKYICPNHCPKSGSDEAGECPTCGMEYIENFDYNK